MNDQIPTTTPATTSGGSTVSTADFQRTLRRWAVSGSECGDDGVGRGDDVLGCDHGVEHLLVGGRGHGAVTLRMSAETAAAISVNSGSKRSSGDRG